MYWNHGGHLAVSTWTMKSLNVAPLCHPARCASRMCRNRLSEWRGRGVGISKLLHSLGGIPSCQTNVVVVRCRRHDRDNVVLANTAPQSTRRVHGTSPIRYWHQRLLHRLLSCPTYTRKTTVRKSRLKNAAIFNPFKNKEHYFYNTNIMAFENVHFCKINCHAFSFMGKI